MNCPKCNSTEIHAEKRGWRLTTGFIGSSKIILTCLECGKQFKPGEKQQSEFDARVLAAVAIAAILLVLGVLYRVIQ